MMLTTMMQSEQRSLTGSGPITMADLASLWSYGPTDSGMYVSEQTAMAYSAVYCAIRVLSESIASLSLKVYSLDNDNSRKVASGHPVYRLLHDAPNPEMTPAVFKETIQSHVVGWGNGYAKIVRDNSNRPVELWPLLPDRTYPQRRNGDLIYVTQVGEEKEEILDKSNVLHIPGLGYNGLRGFSPISLARQSIGLGLSLEQFDARFFQNGAWLGGVLEHPGQLGQDAARTLRESWSKKHSGTVNAWKPAILEEGMKWNQVKLPADDAMFLQLRKFQVTEIARWYRVPPHMLGDLERATFSNIEQQGTEFARYTLGIWLTKWEEEISRKLLQGRYEVNFDVSDFLRGDTTARYDSYQKGRLGGWLSINDVRRHEGLNPVPNGDDYLQPTNYTPVGKPQPEAAKSTPIEADNKQPKANESDSQVDQGKPEQNSRDITRLIKASARNFADVGERMTRKETKAIGSASDKRDAPTFVDWLDAFCLRHKDHVMESLIAPAEALAESICWARSVENIPDDLMVSVCQVVAMAAEDHIKRLRDEAITACEHNVISEAIDGWKINGPSLMVGVGQRVADMTILKLKEVENEN